MSDDAHLAHLSRIFAEAPVSRWLGQELVSCGDGRARVRLPFKPEFLQGLNVIHGGIIGAMADTAGYFAAASLVPDGATPTIEFKINLVASAREEALIAEGTVMHRGRTMITVQMHVTGEKDRLIALGQGTYAVRRTRVPAE